MILTELSEELNAVFNDLDGVSLRLNKLLSGTKSEAEKEYPGLDFQLTVSRERVSVITRKLERFFAGREFPSGMHAIDETSGYLQTKAEPHLIRCASRGITCGEAVDQLTAMTFRERNDFLETNEFTVMELPNFIAISEDIEARIVVVDRFATMFSNFTINTGLASATGKETRQIFPAWNSMLGAASAGFYVLGMDLGKARAEKRQFDEIVANSMSNPHQG